MQVRFSAQPYVAAQRHNATTPHVRFGEDLTAVLGPREKVEKAIEEVKIQIKKSVDNNEYEQAADQNLELQELKSEKQVLTGGG